MADTLAAIHCEIHRERELGHRVDSIRISSAGLPGTVVALPVQSMRFKLGIRPEVRREILVHPDDWELLMRELHAWDTTREGGTPERPVAIDGVPIRHYA